MRTNKIFIAIACLAVTAVTAACSVVMPTVNTYADPEITSILNSMTMEEKVGQMTQLNLDVVCVGDIYNLSEPHRLDSTKLQKALVQYHVGSILNCGGHAYPREQWLQIIGGIQKVATEQTRLKIPVLYGVDAIHGANYVMGSTLFPQQLAQAATFNTDLTKKASEITAYETRAAGIPWNFSPVLDCGRNPLWSRFFETYGEDPLVCARFGEAAIVGYQGNASAGTLGKNNVAACMKHFLGYSGMRTGKDRTPAYIPDIQLRELYLPSFKKAVDAGALTVMINSGEINGVPVHANKKILVNLLRDELKFEGVAVTDWEDIMKLQGNHKVAATLKDAVYMSVEAGIDMCMVPNDYNFTTLLIELVKEGKISEARLDISVARILKLKKKLGILKVAQMPTLADYADFGNKAHAASAKGGALESITLLENKNKVLPLAKSQRVLVTGPAANSMTLLNGAWTRTWQGVDAKYDDNTKNTIYEAIQNIGGDNVMYTQGCDLDSALNVQQALQMAASCDVIIACMGEKPSTEKPGDIDDLELSQAQQDFVKELAKTGKPIILVLVENRPRIVRSIVNDCAAIVMAYQPGDYGADALADILYGLANPSGRLPFTYPRYNHGLLWYDHKYTETLDQNFGNNAFQPQWQFGHGMSYSNIVYSNLKTSSDTLSAGGTITVSVQVTNNSNMSAMQSVLLFSRDHYASITPSVKKLIDFTKITLLPNSSQTVSFSVTPAQLSFIGEDLKPVTEAGNFDFMVEQLNTTFNYKAK
jgi:beta-glucosidase